MTTLGGALFFFGKRRARKILNVLVVWQYFLSIIFFIYYEKYNNFFKGVFIVCLCVQGGNMKSIFMKLKL